MKKLISYLLAVTMLISVLVPVTGGMFSASAAAGDIVADIDFSEDYYSDNTFVVQYNGAHGKALMFNRISIVTENWGFSVLHAIGGDDGSLALPAGETLDVSLEIYKEALPDNAIAGGFGVGILYLTDTEVANVRGTDSTPGLVDYADRIMTLADVDGVLSTDWETFECTITVPEYGTDTKAYMVLYGNGYQTNFTPKVWIDNIVFTEAAAVEPPVEEEEAVADIDFSEDFYSSNTYVVQYNGAHGKALKFNRVSIVTENWGNSVLHAIGDDDGELALPAGKTLDVSLEIYKKALTDNAIEAGFSVGILYLTDTEVANVRGTDSTPGLVDYADRIMTLAEVSGALSTDWEKYEGTITVPEYAADTKAYIVLCGNGYQTNFTPEIWIDNIVFTDASNEPVEPEVVVGDVDGNGAINANDLVVLRKYILGYIEYDATAADVNGDGELNVIDLVALKKKIV